MLAYGKHGVFVCNCLSAIVASASHAAAKRLRARGMRLLCGI